MSFVLQDQSEVVEPSCVACKVSPPEGSHRCKYCDKFVHGFTGSCSRTDDEEDEGYGQKRICLDCWNVHKKKERREPRSKLNPKPSKSLKVSRKRKREDSAEIGFTAAQELTAKATRKRRQSPADVVSAVPTKKSKATPRQVPHEVEELLCFDDWGGKGSPLHSKRGQNAERELNSIANSTLLGAQSQQEPKVKRKKTATFFNNIQGVKERLAFKSSNGVRILPSGSKMGLVNMGGMDFSLERTSPIDSLYQIILLWDINNKEAATVVSKL